MQGGFVSLNACLYALKLELESIRAQYSFSPEKSKTFNVSFKIK